MDAKDLRVETAQGERHARYARPEPLRDATSAPKTDVQARPCAVIGPDRVIPPQMTTPELFTKKTQGDNWGYTDNTYRKPPEYALKIIDHQLPTRNISPRQTYQENMQRIMVPPRINVSKLSESSNNVSDKNLLSNKSVKLPNDQKLYDVPYTVNTINNDQKSYGRNSDLCATNVNPALMRNSTHGWTLPAPARPSRPYGVADMYRHADYSNPSRPISVSRPMRQIPEELMPYETFTQNVRFEPYPINKEHRYPNARYEYINNRPNPYHPSNFSPQHTSLPNKYGVQKPFAPNSYMGYPQVPVKYLEPRVPESHLDSYQRSINQPPGFNISYHGQSLPPGYIPNAGNCVRKVYPFTENTKTLGAKGTYEDHNKMLMDYNQGQMKNYQTSDNLYMNEMRPHPLKTHMMMPPGYPQSNMGQHTHPHYRRENLGIAGYDYLPQYKNNPYSRVPPHFSPSVISPSDSNTSSDTVHTFGMSEDCGYVSQNSITSGTSIDLGNKFYNYEAMKRFEYQYGNHSRSSPLHTKQETNGSKGNKDKNINVRQFLQMWNEGDDECNENNGSKEVGSAIKNSNELLLDTTNRQEEFYVLGLVNVPNEELSKYEHIQKVSKLPENIKGYNSLELLNQFEEVIESSNLNSTPVTLREKMESKIIPTQKVVNNVDTRPLSPLDVESKISQSVIHKEVGCNFEIKPCSPKMLNVEIAAPAHSILEERSIEKVNNPVIEVSPYIKENFKANKQDNEKLVNDIPSCKMLKTSFSSEIDSGNIKTNYTIQDFESNSGVCLASLPRLDTDIELNFPEVNQQFIDANKSEVISHNNSESNASIKSKGSGERPFNETNNIFTKLSKFRKSKVNTGDHTNIQLQRINSVIMKNPENNTNADENIIKLELFNDKQTHTDQKDVMKNSSMLEQQSSTPINLTYQHKIKMNNEDMQLKNLESSINYEERNCKTLDSSVKNVDNGNNISINVAINLSLNTNNTEGQDFNNSSLKQNNSVGNTIINDNLIITTPSANQIISTTCISNECNDFETKNLEEEMNLHLTDPTLDTSASVLAHSERHRIEIEENESKMLNFVDHQISDINDTTVVDSLEHLVKKTDDISVENNDLNVNNSNPSHKGNALSEETENSVSYCHSVDVDNENKNAVYDIDNKTIADDHDNQCEENVTMESNNNVICSSLDSHDNVSKISEISALDLVKDIKNEINNPKAIDSDLSSELQHDDKIDTNNSDSNCITNKSDSMENCRVNDSMSDIASTENIFDNDYDSCKSENVLDMISYDCQYDSPSSKDNIKQNDVLDIKSPNSATLNFLDDNLNNCPRGNKNFVEEFHSSIDYNKSNNIEGHDNFSDDFLRNSVEFLDPSVKDDCEVFANGNEGHTLNPATLTLPITTDINTITCINDLLPPENFGFAEKVYRTFRKELHSPQLQNLILNGTGKCYSVTTDFNLEDQRKDMPMKSLNCSIDSQNIDDNLDTKPLSNICYNRFDPLIGNSISSESSDIKCEIDISDSNSTDASINCENILNSEPIPDDLNDNFSHCLLNTSEDEYNTNITSKLDLCSSDMNEDTIDVFPEEDSIVKLENDNEEIIENYIFLNSIEKDDSNNIPIEVNLEDINDRVQSETLKSLGGHRHRCLKRSLSESYVSMYKQECLHHGRDSIDVSDTCAHEPIAWCAKRKKIDMCNVLQYSRRNSTSIIKDEDVSFCIYITNNCIIEDAPVIVDDDNSQTETIAVSKDICNDSTEDEIENHTEVFENYDGNTGSILCEEDNISDTWVDDVACVETVISDNIEEDTNDYGSDSETQSNEIEDPELSEDVEHNETLNVNLYSSEIKDIYGKNMSKEDLKIVETFYRTPQMNVNDILNEKETPKKDSQELDIYRYQSIESILTDNIQSDGSCRNDEIKRSRSIDNEDYSIKDSLKCVLHESVNTLNELNHQNNCHGHNQHNELLRDEPDYFENEMQDDTVHSCESTKDDHVLSSMIESVKCVSTSSSPEVTSTTMEEKNSRKYLKIKIYNGDRVSVIEDNTTELVENKEKKLRCKFTELTHYVTSKSSRMGPLITKAAKKYIPPLNYQELKVKLRLPQHSLLRLKEMKSAKEEPKITDQNMMVCRNDCNKLTIKKVKPNFEEVLKSIDEIQYKSHKVKRKKIKGIVPKVVIKKSENGSHYASTSNQEFNPDMTGRKWQPWVFLEKDCFIDKMALRKKTKAVFCHQKNMYILLDKLHKYPHYKKTVQDSVRDDVTPKEPLKCTIRLKPN